jgi:hypothetical protein
VLSTQPNTIGHIHSIGNILDGLCLCLSSTAVCDMRLCCAGGLPLGSGCQVSKWLRSKGGCDEAAGASWGGLMGLHGLRARGWELRRASELAAHRRLGGDVGGRGGGGVQRWVRR